MVSEDFFLKISLYKSMRAIDPWGVVPVWTTGAGCMYEIPRHCNILIYYISVVGLTVSEDF